MKTMKSTKKGIIILAILAILIAVSGCTSKVSMDDKYVLGNNNMGDDTTVPTPPPNDKLLITAEVSPYSATEESNHTLVYGGHVYLPTTATGDYLKVMRMYDTAENNVCYVTYNGISCLKREVK